MISLDLIPIESLRGRHYFLSLNSIDNEGKKWDYQRLSNLAKVMLQWQETGFKLGSFSKQSLYFSLSDPQQPPLFPLTFWKPSNYF